MSYLKDLVGQYNPSLLDHLVFAKYVDKNPMRRTFHILEVTAYLMFMTVLIISSVPIPAAIPYADLLLKIQQFNKPIMVAFVLVYYSFQSLSEFEAFDMYVNDKLVFSKEKVGRYPTDEELLEFMHCKME